MIVQAFVPDWPGPKQHAAEVVAVIAPHCPVTILDNPAWYFNEQWREAKRQFTGDVLLWVMADVTPPADFSGMFSEALRVLSKGDVGWYAPDVAWTCYIYNKTDLKEYEPEIYEVPNTDSLCMFISGDLVRAMPEIDPNLSFMWGMDFVAFATARLMGLKTVRDYRFKAEHPNNTGYDIPAASSQMKILFNSFSPEMQREAKSLEAETIRLRQKAQQ